jgi:hypothetical protein
MIQGRCETCRNEAPKLFEVIVCGDSHAFDSFQCAVMALGEHCDFCGLSVKAAAFEQRGRKYCSSSCAASIDD